MFDAIIEQIEFATTQLSWHALLGIGLACAVSGLIIWLTGLGMARVAAATIGGFAGCFIVYIFFRTSAHFLTLGALIGGVLGLALEAVLSKSVGYATIAYNIILALLTALAGTALALLGMVFLTCLKGAKPLDHVSSHQTLYITVIVAMTAFGTIEQLILSRRKKTVTITTKPKHPAIDIEQTERSSWRTK